MKRPGLGSTDMHISVALADCAARRNGRALHNRQGGERGMFSSQTFYKATKP